MARNLFAWLVLVLVLLLVLVTEASAQTITCPAGILVTPNGTGTRGVCQSTPPPTTQAPAIGSFNASASVSQPITLGQTVTFTWSGITGIPAPSLSLVGQNAPGAVTTSPVVVQPAVTGDHTYTFRASNGVMPDATRTWTVRVVPVTPPPVGNIWGVVDPTTLGQCSAATHDLRVLDGGDGWKYRTWHPQRDPTGCIYAHEHGQDPAPALASLEARANLLTEPLRSLVLTYVRRPILFGYIGRRMPMPGEPNGHEEPHEGFKLFWNPMGDENDEHRISRIAALHITHMGTGGPRRFDQPDHSVESRQIHDTGLLGFTRLMLASGTTHTTCDPRAGTITRDVMQLQSPCLLQSSYEIWTMAQTIKTLGRVVYTAFATPAAFDPITVLNPSNRSELVLAWDPRMAASKRFPNDDWSQFRGCARESYAQMGAFENAGGSNEYTTDAVGNVTTSGPLTLTQLVSAVSQNPNAAPGTQDGLAAYKRRRDNCGLAGMLGLKN